MRTIKRGLIWVYILVISFVFYLYLRGYNQVAPTISIAFDVTIYLYSICLITGVAVAVYVAKRIAYPELWKQIDKLELLGYLLLPGIIGARIYHVITDYNLYTDNPLAMLYVWEGGLGIIGGMIGGFAGLYVYCRKKNIALHEVLRVLVVVFPIAQAIGRLGNFFNQEIFGYPTDLPWGMFVNIENRPVEYIASEFFHPLFLYEALANLILCAILYQIYRRGMNGYRLAIYYLAGYGLIRFALDLLRVEGENGFGGLSYAQWLILAMCWGAFLFGIGYQVWYKRTYGKWFTRSS